jgi:hypothetical protein
MKSKFVSRLIAWVAACVGLLSSPSLFAAESGALPVFMLERYYSVPQSQKQDLPPRVGDILKFRWVGEPKPPASAVEVAIHSPSGTGSSTANSEPVKSLNQAGWEVYSQPKDDPTIAFSMIPLRPGKVELPILEVRDADGKVLGVTQALGIEVEAVASAEEMKKKPADFLPPLEMSFPWKWVLGWLLVIAVIGALIARMYWKVWRKRKGVAPVAATEAFVRKLSSDEEAIERLARLEREAFWKGGRFKPHYFGVSEILKKYIERRFEFDAAESTTRELLRALSDRGVASSHLMALTELFERLDRVKFTDFVPSEDEAVSVLNDARSWVQAARASGGSSHAV